MEAKMHKHQHINGPFYVTIFSFTNSYCKISSLLEIDLIFKQQTDSNATEIQNPAHNSLYTCVKLLLD